MEGNRRQRKRSRTCVEESGLDLDNKVETDMSAQGELMALLEQNVESFDAEEEDLKGIAGMEEMITKLMKSLEMEIALPKCLLWQSGSYNSCCLQSDSAVSMSISSSTLSDPCHLNLGTKCMCVREDEEDGKFEFLFSDEHHELIPGSPFCGFDMDGNDLLEGLTAMESSSMEWMDLDVLGVLG